MTLRIKGAFIAKSKTKFTIIDYLIFMLFATASFTHAVGMLFLCCEMQTTFD